MGARLENRWSSGPKERMCELTSEGQVSSAKICGRQKIPGRGLSDPKAHDRTSLTAE